MDRDLNALFRRARRLREEAAHAINRARQLRLKFVQMRSIFRDLEAHDARNGKGSPRPPRA